MVTCGDGVRSGPRKFFLVATSMVDFSVASFPLLVVDAFPFCEILFCGTGDLDGTIEIVAFSPRISEFECFSNDVILS